METQADLAVVKENLAAERAAHNVTRNRMLGDQAAYRQDREAFEEVLQRSLTEISDLKAQGKGYQKRIAQLETELRAVQRGIMRALDASPSSPEGSIVSTGRSAAPKKSGGASPAPEHAVSADSGADRSFSPARRGAHAHAPDERMDRVISSMSSVSITPSADASSERPGSPSQDQISMENKIREEL